MFQNAFHSRTLSDTSEMNSFKLFSTFFISIYWSHVIAEAFIDFKLETTSLCPNNRKLPATILVMNTFNTNGKVCTYAEIEVKETFKGPIEVKYMFILRNGLKKKENYSFMQMEMQLERCNEDLSECTTYPSMVRDNVCNEFNTTFYGTEFFSRIQPLLKCPINTVSAPVST